MSSTCIQYVFVFHSTRYTCDSRIIIISIHIVNSSENQQYNVGEKPTVIR